MADKDKKSPWLKRELEQKDEVEPADLPEEVYGQKIEDDDDRMDRQVMAARLLETPIPPPESWKACWACGKKVPMRFRDPVSGILVCFACRLVSSQQDLYSKSEGLLTEIIDHIAPGALGDDDDQEDEPGEDQETDEQNADSTEQVPKDGDE